MRDQNRKEHVKSPRKPRCLLGVRGGGVTAQKHRAGSPVGRGRIEAPGPRQEARVVHV